MNSNEPTQVIANYDDLMTEKKRLETLIENQKNIIRHDFDELKNQFKREIKPALDAAAFVKKVVKPETRNQSLLQIGTTFAIDLAVRKLLGRSNIFIQLIVPKLIRTYTNTLLRRAAAQKITAVRE